MARLATLVALGLTAAGLAFVLATSSVLPPVVATHFGPGGVANGWMPREAYRTVAIALVLVLPLGSLGMSAFVTGDPSRISSLPYRDHWLAPRQLESTKQTVRTFGATIAILCALLAIGIHAAILSANRRSPPSLDEPVFVAGVVAFVAAVLAAVIALTLRFRNPGRE